MVETIFSNPLSIEAILPFLLVFTLVFAVLEKTAILGKDKSRNNVLIALVSGLIVISFSYPVSIINGLIPFMAVTLVILFIFLMLVAFLFKPESFDLPSWAKLTLGIILFIAVAIAVLYFTGAWNYILNLFSGEERSAWITNGVFIVLIVGVVLAVILGGKDSSEKKKD